MPLQTVFTLDNLIVHVIPAVAAGGAAWGGVKFALKNLTERVNHMESTIRSTDRKVGWTARKVSQIAMLHNLNHAGQHVEIDDFPDNNGSRS